MQISSRQAKGILTPQTTGFLVNGEFPFTHALSPYTGCAFGNTTCGLYCYAAALPSWTYRPANMKPYAWGAAVEAKENAAELLAMELGKLSPARRQLLRIFASSSTDPYQPIEKEKQITRQLLRVFTQYKDLDLLVLRADGEHPVPVALDHDRDRRSGVPGQDEGRAAARQAAGDGAQSRRARHQCAD